MPLVAPAYIYQRHVKRKWLWRLAVDALPQQDRLKLQALTTPRGIPGVAQLDLAHQAQ